MIKEFDKLSDHEVEIMLKAPVLVCILIAGADGHIDKKEIKEAISIAQKNKNSKSVLAGYFREVSQDFEDKIKILVQSYPSGERSDLIVGELSQVNGIFKKLDVTFAKAFYDMLRDIAGRIASSSGGLLGLKKVDDREAQFMQLPMIADPTKN